MWKILVSIFLCLFLVGCETTSNYGGQIIDVKMNGNGYEIITTEGKFFTVDCPLYGGIGSNVTIKAQKFLHTYDLYLCTQSNCTRLRGYLLNKDINTEKIPSEENH